MAAERRYRHPKSWAPSRAPACHARTGRSGPAESRAAEQANRLCKTVGTSSPCPLGPTYPAYGVQDAPRSRQDAPEGSGPTETPTRPPRGRHAPRTATAGQGRPCLRMWRHREPVAKRKAGHCPRSKDGGDGSRRTWAGGLARMPTAKTRAAALPGGSPPLYICRQYAIM